MGFAAGVTEEKVLSNILTSARGLCEHAGGGELCAGALCGFVGAGAGERGDGDVVVVAGAGEDGGECGGGDSGVDGVSAVFDQAGTIKNICGRNASGAELTYWVGRLRKRGDAGGF